MSSDEDLVDADTVPATKIADTTAMIKRIFFIINIF
jgi:hypothetical protein